MVGARVNYLLLSVVLVVTVSGEPEEVLEIDSFFAWVKLGGVVKGHTGEWS